MSALITLLIDDKALMNKYRIITYWLLLLTLSISCSKNEQQGGVSIDLLNGVNDSLGYSLFVDSIENLKLDATDSCLIGRIKDMAISRERLFLFDEQQQTIWIFNREGRYLNKISKKGDGPGEYARISQFEYDDKNNQIIVLSPWKKVLMFYSPEGEYKRTVELPMRINDFKVCAQGGFILSNSGLDEPTAGIYYVNDSGKEIKCLVKRKSNHLVYTTSNWELCSYGDIICFMAPNFDNTVYHFENQSLSVEFPFSVKPDLKHDYKETVSLQNFEDFIRTTYLEGEKWIWATYWSSVDDLRILLYSKETGKYWIGKSMINDLDSEGTGVRTSVTGDNMFVTWRENDNPNENPIISILHLK